MDAARIGTVKGPGESPNEYTFIAPDPERRVRHGEFVYYSADSDGVERQILGRVTARMAVKSYPDAFMADPAIAPGEIAALLGYEGNENQLFEITVAVLGYHDANLGDFINPRVPPLSGSPVYLASNEMLAQVLSKRMPASRGSAMIGSLLSRPAGDVPVALDVRGFTSTHLAIIASTGSGKSYLAGVLLEELMMPYNRASVLIIDPHGEYDTLQEIQNLPQFREGAYKPTVRVYRPDTVRIRIDSLTAGDLRYLLPNLSEKMSYQIGRAVGYCQRNFHNSYSLEQLMYAVRQTAEGKREGDDAEEDATTGALIWRLSSVLKGSRIFNDNDDLPLRDLVRPGQCTVLQLNEVDQREQQVTAATLLRRIYTARVKTVKGKVARGNKEWVPAPCFTLIEEAHNFAPANADAVTTDQLKTILSEGRKFGVSVGLITQRPGKLDGDVLSQCMTQCIMRITNPIDQDRIASSVESVGRDLMRELASLSKGQVIVSGASINTPVLVRVRTRLTRHGGVDVDAPKEWHEFFTGGADATDAMDDALTVDKRLVYEDDGDVLRARPRR